ncbi:MAG TPA: MFS transporter [Candidatus Dormibacteraeota bacterium]
MITPRPHSAATQVPALLVGSALLRIGAAGGGVAVQFDLSDLAGGSPSGFVVGTVGAAQAASELVFAFALARVADRVGRSRFLIGGPLVGCVAMLLVAASTRPAQIAVARLVEGIGAAAFVPTALGTIAAATSADPRARAQASGAFEGSTLVGFIGGFLVGGFAYHAFGRGAFVILAGFYLAAALVCALWIPRVPPMHTSPLKVVLHAIVGKGPIRTFIPAWLAVNALVGAWLLNLPALLKRTADENQTLVHHFDERVVSGILGFWAMLLILGIVLWTPFLQRHGGAVTMRRAVPGVFLVVGALFAMNHMEGGRAVYLLPLAIVGVLWQAGFGPAAVAYLADCSESLAADRSALMAFYTVTLAGGGALGALIGGLFSGWLRIDGLLLLGLILGTIAFVSLSGVVEYDRKYHLATRSAAAPSAGGP